MDESMKRKNKIMDYTKDIRNQMKTPAKPKRKAQYKYMGGKIDDKNYAGCGANIMRTK